MGNSSLKTSESRTLEQRVTQTKLTLVHGILGLDGGQNRKNDTERYKICETGMQRLLLPVEDRNHRMQECLGLGHGTLGLDRSLGLGHCMGHNIL